jgi:hypothetical protein
MQHMGKFDNLTQDEVDTYKAESAQRTNEPSPDWELRSKQLTRVYEAVSADREDANNLAAAAAAQADASSDYSAGNAGQQ